MSKVYDVENQLILRVPPEIAKKINESMAKIDNKETDFFEMIPFYENSESDSLKFQFRYGNFQSVASIIELPSVIESHRTLDHINYFKSNDISQMIYVQPNKEDNFEKLMKSRKIAKKVICKDCNRRNSKWLAFDGLTQPTKRIRTRFFRKKLVVNPDEVKMVEKSLIAIHQELSKNKKAKVNENTDSQLNESVFNDGSSVISLNSSVNHIKRRYRRKLL